MTANCPFIRFRCSCGRSFDVALVPWEFKTDSMVRCQCGRVAEAASVYLDSRKAPAIERDREIPHRKPRQRRR